MTVTSIAEDVVRIAWVTPLHPQSAIGKYSRTVALALAAHHGVAVDLWAVEVPGRLEVPGLAVRDLELPAWREAASGYDAVFYNFGNNVEYHAAVFEAYLHHPGIVIMHDRYMLGFFFYSLIPPRATCPTRAGLTRLIALMTHLYGDEGRRAATSLIRQEPGSYDALVEGGEMTLLEPCMANATGLITHSRTALDVMRTHAPDRLAMRRLSLPFVDESGDRDWTPLSRSDLGLPENRWLLVSSGQLQPSKRIEVLIDAIAASPVLRERVLLVAAGDERFAGAYVDELRMRARHHGIPDSLIITGALDDREYYSTLLAADACAALRGGKHETASATLAEQLFFGKAVIVCPTGVFGETPDHVVMKLDPFDETASATRILESLVLDGTLVDSYSRAAFTYAREVLSSEVYARGCLEFITTLHEARFEGERFQQAADDLVRKRASSAVVGAALASAEAIVRDVRSKRGQ